MQQEVNVSAVIVVVMEESDNQNVLIKGSY